MRRLVTDMPAEAPERIAGAASEAKGGAAGSSAAASGNGGSVGP